MQGRKTETDFGSFWVNFCAVSIYYGSYCEQLF